MWDVLIRNLALHSHHCKLQFSGAVAVPNPIDPTHTSGLHLSTTTPSLAQGHDPFLLPGGPRAGVGQWHWVLCRVWDSQGVGVTSHYEWRGPSGGLPSS